MKLINGIWRPAVTVYCDGYAPTSQIKVEGFKPSPNKGGWNNPRQPRARPRLSKDKPMIRKIRSGKAR
jgi:hypothetical protein